jgi:hypothetical protein
VKFDKKPCETESFDDIAFALKSRRKTSWQQKKRLMLKKGHFYGNKKPRRRAGLCS